MAAVSAMAERPDRITRFVLNSEIEENSGAYAFNMYALGVPFTMVIDD